MADIEHLVNGLPTIGSVWVSIRESGQFAKVIGVEPPVTTADAYQILVERFYSDDMSTFIYGGKSGEDLSGFLNRWATKRPESEPETEPLSKWERLMLDDDLI